MKRLIILGLACLSMCITACGGEPPDSASFISPTRGTSTVRIGVPQDVQTLEWAEGAQREVNRLLEEEGAYVRLEIVLIKTESPLTPSLIVFHEAALNPNDDRFDLYAAMEFAQKSEELARASLALDITDLLPYYSDLYAVNQEQVWREESVDGRSYWLPLAQYPQGVDYAHEIQMDPAWLEELAAEPPRTLEEMAELLRRARDRGLPYKLSALTYAPPYALHRTYPEWPFYVDNDSLLIYYADGGTKPYIGSDIYMRDAAILQELDADGLIEWNWDGRIPLVPKERGIAMSMYGAYTWSEDTYSAALEPDRPSPRTRPFASGAVFLKPICQNPEAALEMLQYLYCNEKIFLAFVYGMEGKDWVFQEDGSILRLTHGNARDYFYHHEIALRYAPPEKLRRINGLLAQEYPFSGFVSLQTDYTGRRRVPGNYYSPEGGEALLTVANDPEYQALCQERQRQYEEFLQ